MKSLMSGLFLSALSTLAAADNAILVLDASGSMWGKLGDKSKIEIARGAVADLLKSWPTEHQLGLVAYGHRRKGDCTDIETLLPYANLDTAAFQAKVNALNPMGMTPISAAVLRAADALKSSEQKATVILVSDGEETCNMDPCAIAEQLEASGVDFTAHVVGFDVEKSSKAERQLQCIAARTGGQYFNANDAQTLSNALGRLSTAKPSAPAPLPKASLNAPDTVAKGTTLAIAWTGPNAALDSIEIALAGGGAQAGYVYTKDGNPAQLAIPGAIGNYELRYRFNDLETIAARPIIVVDASVSLSAPSSVPIDTEFEIEWVGPNAELDTIILARVGDEGYESYTYISGGSPARLSTPSAPGSYELRYRLRDSEVIATRRIEVTAE